MKKDTMWLPFPNCQVATPKQKALNELTTRTKEAIEAYLEAEGYEPKTGIELIGFQFIEVHVK
jgi:hypothetical protein